MKIPNYSLEERQYQQMMLEKEDVTVACVKLTKKEREKNNSTHANLNTKYITIRLLLNHNFSFLIQPPIYHNIKHKWLQKSHSLKKIKHFLKSEARALSLILHKTQFQMCQGLQHKTWYFESAIEKVCECTST